MKKIFFLLFFIFELNYTFSQENPDSTKFAFSQGNLLFSPAKSNLTENRTGLIQDFASSKLRLDIGYSPDFLALLTNKSNFSLGADFHAFGLLFNESERVILQVAAIDAIFGGHISWKKEFSSFKLSSRFRVLHLSSHLVDGHYDFEKNEWKNKKLPIAFGREYVDLFSCFEKDNLRLYLGSDFIFRQRPNVLTKINPEASVDYIFRNLLANEISLYFSGSLKLAGVNDIRCLNKTIECGINFNNKKPLNLFLLYYSGLNYYGEYYDQLLRYFGIGFNLELL